MPGEPQLTTAGAILDAALRGERRTSGGRQIAAPGAGEEPGDEVEELIAAFFSAALGVERVPRGAAFTALGGDSLMAISILSWIWRDFGLKLPIRSVVPGGSVATVAAAVSRARRAGLPAPSSVSVGAAAEKELASDNQAAIWFLESDGEAGPLYNVPSALRLSGPLDVEALRVSLERLVSRHEALRMRFGLDGGRLMQEPIRAAELQLPLTDLAGAPDPELSARELASAHVATPIDLDRPPLIRPQLLRLGPQDHLLVLAVHHVACDAWSIKLMLRELAEAYSSPGLPGRTSPSAPRFLDFVAWQREMLDGPEGERLLRHWGEALSGVDPTPLPTDRPRSEAHPSVGDVEPVELCPQAVGELRRVAGGQGMTLYMLLLAAHSIAIGACLDRREVVVGSPVANREQPTAEIVGYLANMLPMRIRLGGDPTLRELFARVRSTALDAYDHQALPFPRLVRELAPPRQAGCNPIFQTALVLNEMRPRPFGDLSASEVILHTGTSKLDLTCYLEERDGGGLEGYLEYASGLIGAATARRIRAAFESVLAEVGARVEQPLSEMEARLEEALDDRLGRRE